MSRDLEQPVAAAALAAVADLLAAEDKAGEDRAALLARAADLCTDVAQTGPWHSLRDLALVARRIVLAGDADVAEKDAALALISRLTSADTVAALVRAVVDLGGLTAELEALLAVAGSGAIWEIARILRKERDARAAEELRHFCTRVGGESWRRVLQEAGERSFADVSALLPLVAQLDPNLARPLAHRLLEHPDGRVRTRVLAYLLNLEPKDLGWQRLAEWALGSPEKELADVARAAVLRLDPPNEDLLQMALMGGGSPAEGRILEDLERRLAELRSTEGGRE